MQQELDLQARWATLEEKFRKKFGKTPDVEAVLFLIGIQELRNSQKIFTKEQKQDLMHIAVCSLLEQSGYYRLTEYDGEGWPHFEQLKPLPSYNTRDQEHFLKDHVLLYFDQQENSWD